MEGEDHRPDAGHYTDGREAGTIGTGRSPSRPKGPPLPDFPNLRDHAGKHPIDGVAARLYYDHAVWHSRNAQQRFQVLHDNQWKYVYVTRTGPDNFIFTSGSLNRRFIFTHMQVDGQYIRNKGVTVRSYPPIGPYPSVLFGP